MKLLLLPLVIPAAVVWVFVGIFAVLIPCELIAFSLLALGYEDECERIMDWATDTIFFQTAPWTWLRA